MPSQTQQRRSHTVLTLLSVSQGFYLSAMSIDLTITALAGASLAPNPMWATLPIAAISLGSIVVAPVVSRVMVKAGTKPTLIAGTLTAILGGILSWLAMTHGVFLLLCCGTFAVGVYQSIANYYRYIAADSTPGSESRSVAVVLSAGVVAAVIGPMIATATSHLLVPTYAGSYVAVSALGLAALVTVALLPRHLERATAIKPDQPSVPASQVDIRDLFGRPRFTTGALLSFTGCFSMAAVMSGAPLELEYDLHAAGTTRMFAMQLHMVGMYAPMLVLPLLARRLGHLAQTTAGTTIGLVGLLAGFAGTVPAVEVTLFLVGVCWAVSYATGSALLTTAYTASERRIARGVGEAFPVLGLTAGGLLAGPLITQMGWHFLLGVCTVFLLFSAALSFRYRSSLT